MKREMLNEHVDEQLDVKIGIKDFERDSRIRLEWMDISVEAVLPNVSCVKKMKACCCGGREQVLEKTKPILKNVSGVAEPGSLLAIMGASGAGKSTLLNVLSRQSLSRLRLTGTTLINNKKIKDEMKTLSAYVRQEDYFIGTLTVKEHLRFQALLRMGQHYTLEEKEKRVDDVMTELGLLKCQNTIIGVPGRIRGISGGELKRLAFASEIITNPKLLFVDEPTSGLDSYMAENVVLALQRLASEGRTILATIHQPSSPIFTLFDRLLLLSQGRVAFMGSSSDAVQFFDRIGYPCPLNYNPADHYIRTLAIFPDNEEECLAKSESICDSFSEETKKRPKAYMTDEEELGFADTKRTLTKSDRLMYRTWGEVGRAGKMHARRGYNQLNMIPT